MDGNNENMEVRQDKEIDLLALAQKLWASKRMVFKWVGIAALLGLVIGFSIPAEYEVSVKMVAEDSRSNSRNGELNQLMSLAGVSTGDRSDGIGVTMYPQVVSSIPFLADMRGISVFPKDLRQSITLYEYITEYQKIPWWKHILSLPSKILSAVFSLFQEKEKADVSDKFDLSALTGEQAGYIGAMRQRATIILDRKNSIISANVCMQDPVVAAVVADSLVSKLKAYVIRYRTDKARQDLDYNRKTFEESKKQYYRAQQYYAAFVDQNKNIVKQSVKVEQDRLSNEMSLAYGVYAAMAQQLEMAKLKVQEQTPCVTVIEPATVPLQKTKPKKMTILLGFMFLGGLAACGKVIAKELLPRFQKSSSNPK